MTLKPRQERILRAVVEEYIASGSPVGSRYLSEPATSASPLPRSATTSSSSRKTGCSRTRTPPPGGCRPTPATGTTSTPSSASSASATCGRSPSPRPIGRRAETGRGAARDGRGPRAGHRDARRGLGPVVLQRHHPPHRGPARCSRGSSWSSSSPTSGRRQQAHLPLRGARRRRAGRVRPRVPQRAARRRAGWARRLVDSAFTSHDLRRHERAFLEAVGRRSTPAGGLDAEGLHLGGASRAGGDAGAAGRAAPGRAAADAGGALQPARAALRGVAPGRRVPAHRPRDGRRRRCRRARWWRPTTAWPTATSAR